MKPIKINVKDQALKNAIQPKLKITVKKPTSNPPPVTGKYA